MGPTGLGGNMGTTGLGTGATKIKEKFVQEADGDIKHKLKEKYDAK